jgi:glycosyltransferase involved in cell wall biosynthesis
VSVALSADPLLQALESGAYFQRLVSRPSPHPHRVSPDVFLQATMSSEQPRFTMVTPTFNHEQIIQRTIHAALTHATMAFDWIFIDDGSEDATCETIVEALRVADSTRISSALILRNRVPIYETACDNLGFTLAQTDVIIELQADIEIREPGFDRLLHAPLSTTPAPAAVSGRCGHTFAFLLRSRMPSFVASSMEKHAIGLFDTRIETPAVIEPLRGRFFRCETVPRGPWLVLKRDLERHGYLDERFFFLGNDDHDYHRRMYQAERRRPVYVPMSIHSPLSTGPTRRPRSGTNLAVFEFLASERSGNPAFRRFVWWPKRPMLPTEISVST